MHLPVVHGVIARRLLVNYRVDPDALADVLPAPFRPQLVDGHAIAGICLIRLAGVRPRGLPAAVGIGSENAAHRIAIEWDDQGMRRSGVYIPRRDTDSPLNVLLGGRLFPGVHHRARFTSRESDDEIAVALESTDGATRVSITGRVTTALPRDSIFPSLQAASDFFERGAVGYSATRRTDGYDGLELRSTAWRVEPLAVERVSSSFFEDAMRFPPGSVAFDSALVMRDVPHEWHALEPLGRASRTGPAA